MVAELLFPGWSNPLGLVALVASRFVVNVSVSALAVRTLPSPTPLVAVGATVLSLVLTVGVLRPGLLGLQASYLEAVVQLTLVAVAVYAGYTSSSRTLTVLGAVTAILALALLAVSVPIYGEATVAP